jgi:CubicO group peptidase (beta-lactamase class C family)
MGPSALIEQAFAPAAASIRDGNIPGAVLGIVTADGERTVRWAGHAQIEPEREIVSRETWFDLASLTKVIFTTTRILDLVEAGRIALDDPLVRVIPDLRQYDMNAAERRLTFRQCLAHQTHLPGVEPLYTYGQDPNTLRAFILQRVWQAGPPVYSDINFMLLGIAIERITGQALIDQPLPEKFSFRPDPNLCAATEKDTWRGRVIRGEVHDENAYALGGASGHAGLFGTIDGVLDFAHSLFDGSARVNRRSARSAGRASIPAGTEAIPALPIPSVIRASRAPAYGSISSAASPGRCSPTASIRAGTRTAGSWRFAVQRASR